MARRGREVIFLRVAKYKPAIISNLVKRRRFTFQDIVKEVRKHVNSEFAIFLATDVLATICEEHRKRTGKPPASRIF